MSKKAILISANPNYGTGGDVNKHKEHADKFGKVFWPLIPPGDRDIKWAHDDIEKGYFYTSGTSKKIQYEFLIDNAGKISDFEFEKHKRYLHEDREWLWKKPKYGYRYALLITNINKLTHEISLDKFTLARTNEPVKRVMNYVIVKDKLSSRGS